MYRLVKVVSEVVKRLERIERLLIELNSKIDNFLGYEDLSAEEHEELRKMREEVKKGELDPQDVRNILAIERDLLDRTHEAIEKTMGNPENLIENKKAYGVEDKFMVKREALEKMHEELRPHFETARVKIPIKGKDINFDGLLVL